MAAGTAEKNPVIQSAVMGTEIAQVSAAPQIAYHVLIVKPESFSKCFFVLGGHVRVKIRERPKREQFCYYPNRKNSAVIFYMVLNEKLFGVVGYFSLQYGCKFFMVMCF